MKFFNFAGPCDPRFHYMIPASARLPEARQLIEQGAYFAMHAPRQTGKTTTLRALATEITAAGRFAALYFSCDRLRMASDIEEMQTSLLRVMREMARLQLPADCQPPLEWPQARGALSLLSRGLASWCRTAARPLALLFDELDVLTGDPLIAVLSQLRDDYADRPDNAPWSVALCGLRDVGDETAAVGGDPQRLASSIPFNINTASLRLSNFTRDEVAALYAQHTAAGGARFPPETVDAAMRLTAGQPWLVNALARDLVEHHPGAAEVTPDDADAAADRLIRACATHLDSLLARLREPRVRRIIKPLLAGTRAARATYREDFDYTHDLGLVVADPELRVANPIYREVIARELALTVEHERLPGPRRFVTADGRLDLRA